MKVRTRIAPSPTGDPHVGTAYIALFNLCFARQHEGQFILRIEDTDQVRSTKESEERILEALRWVGLQWDEGPDVGGDFGPYRQSERADIYKEYSAKLLDDGHAFHCFCSTERLGELRKEQMANKERVGYDGHCLSLSTDDVQQKLQAGESSVVRMKIPSEGVCKIQDTLRGEVEIEWSQVDMQVLVKADGLPTYHLANVVDDHLMEITHVIRGEEWISSAPKHILLYQYFGWQAPEFCHMPLLRNPDKSKLSKRKNPTSILYYQKMGYMSEALLNYLGRMGWSMPDEREQFSIAEMIEHFDLTRVSLGGPIFDKEKLDWLNGNWIRDLSEEQFSQRVAEWAFNKQHLNPAIPLIQSRVEKFSDIAPLAGFMVSGLLDVKEDSFEHKKVDKDTARKVLQFVSWQIDVLFAWDKANIEEGFTGLANAMELKFRDFVFPLFVAISGKAASVSVMDAMVFLGPDLSRARIRHAVEVLGGVSKKESKRWVKEYQQLDLSKES
ncbi:MAG: glutamate--tRNA ligase [Gammaproteobacteria bacterium]|nr:MAG: glutamate--tRNA ligase [Gammaproteobacteria bacterium]